MSDKKEIEPTVCKECNAAGKQVIIDVFSVKYNEKLGRTFIDTTGWKHIHAGLSFFAIYMCSNGHQWFNRTFSTCSCGWTSKDLPQPKDEALLKIWKKQTKRSKI